jgi:hypothetical protein
MIGAVFPFPPYAFVPCTGTTLLLGISFQIMIVNSKLIGEKALIFADGLS